MHPTLAHPFFQGPAGSESPALEIICLLVLALIPFGLWFANKWEDASHAAAKAAEKQARNQLSYKIVQAHLDGRLDELRANLLAVQYDISEIRAQRSVQASPVMSVSSCEAGQERRGKKSLKK